jgi:hypothetical protein
MGGKSMISQLLPGVTLPHWRPWREVAILALIIMDLCWIVPWFRSFTPATHANSSARAFLILGSMLLTVHLLARWMNYAYLRMDYRRVALVIMFIFSFIVGLRILLYGPESVSLGELIDRPLRAFTDWSGIIPAEFLVLLFVFLVYRRAISLAQASIGPLLVKRNFQLGILMFVAFVFLNTIATGETPGFLLYLFTFAGLIAMAASRIYVLSKLRGGGQSPFDRRWFLGIFLSTLAVVALAAWIAGFASLRLVFLERIFGLVFQVFAFLITILITPIIYLLFLLVSRFEFPSDAALRLLSALEQLRTTLRQLAESFAFRLNFLGWLARLKPLLLWSVAIALVLLVVGSITRWWIREQAKDPDERQSLLGGVTLLRLLGHSLRNGLLQIGQGLAELARLRYGQRLLAAARIRRIYAELMDLSEALNAPRAEAQTPLEFLPTLMGLFPESEIELNTITQAYLRVRYGELPETRAEVMEVETAWDWISTLGKERLGNKQE